MGADFTISIIFLVYKRQLVFLKLPNNTNSMRMVADFDDSVKYALLFYRINYPQKSNSSCFFAIMKSRTSVRGYGKCIALLNGKYIKVNGSGPLWPTTLRVDRGYSVDKFMGNLALYRLDTR